MAFDSCQRDAVVSDQISLTNYPIVIWGAGNQLTNVFSSAAQTRVTDFLNGGGHLFASGSQIARSLGRNSGPTAADRAFLTNQLHCMLTSDANTNSGIYTVTAVGGSIFAGNGNATFDNGSKGIYWVQYPDVLTPSGTGATAAINYSGAAAAGVCYDGSAGGGRVVVFGFPFETITSATLRNNYMADILDFFPTATPPEITTQPQSQTVAAGANATFSLTAAGTAPLTYQWRFSGTNIIGAVASSYTRTNAQPNHAGSYSVIITNSAGFATSAVATLTVNMPVPAYFELISLNSNGLQLSLSGETDATYSVESSTNLLTWIEVTNFVNTNGTFQFIDGTFSNHQRRFFRAKRME
jgi:hypothetical protein